MNKKSAQKGFLAPPILIGIGIIILVIIVLAASGVIKTSFKITKTGEAPQTESREEVVTPTSSPTPTIKVQALDNIYTDKGNLYSIKYPTDWLADSSGAPSFFSKDEGATSISQSPAAATVTYTPLGSMKGAQFATLVDTVRVSFKKEFPNITIDVDQSIKIGGYDGHLLGFVYENNGKDFQTNAYIVADDKNLYNILTVAKKSDVEKYKTTLEAIVNSFKLL